MTENAARRLLVVDDEPTVRDSLSATLRFVGYEVAAAATAAEALARARGEPPDLVLLDVMLPDLDGFEVIRRLREQLGTAQDGSGAVPVLFLTARDSARDKVNGLRLGGDDYITKPFDPEELIARIDAVLRRTGGSPHRGVLSVADLELDVDGRRVRRGGRSIRLSPTEFRLLHCLMRSRGRVLPKRQILEQVWRYDFGGDSSILDTYISYLRRKLDDGRPKLIHTVHGVGYVLRAPDS